MPYCLTFPGGLAGGGAGTGCDGDGGGGGGGEGGDDDKCKKESHTLKVVSDGGTAPRAGTDHPIDLKFGTAIEGETDLLLVGPGMTWTQSRSYNSGLTGGGVLGNRWATSNTELFIVDKTSSKEVIYTANSKLVFSGDDTSGYTPPPGRRMTLEYVSASAEYLLTNVDTGAVAIFYDFSVSPLQKRGKIKEFTSIAWKAAGKTGITYAYSYVAGVLDSLTITTSGEQAASVTSTFANGQLKSLSLSDTGTLTKKVEYNYFGDVTGATSQSGSAGDLVHVKVSRRATGDASGTLSIVRHTIYRYGSGSRLKGAYNHAAVTRALAHFSQTDPQWLLTQTDDHQVGGTGPKLQDFANRWFTYYTSDVSTVSINTPWKTGDTLEADYTTATGGAANRDETNFVESERIDSAACSSCGSGTGSGITRTYFYLQLDQGSVNDDNEVRYLIVEDTKDSTGAQYRKIFGLNADGRKLREVFIDNPLTSPKYWCQSWKLVETSEWNGMPAYPKKRYHIKEFRPPSAHNVASLTDAEKFLDPLKDGTGWANDTAVLRTASDTAAGPTYLFTYDNDGRKKEKRIKQGHDASSEYFVAARDYGDGSTVPAHLPVKYYQYPSKVTSKTATPHIEWGLAYEFWDTAKTQLRKATTTYPTIDTSQNGSGATVTAQLWYDRAGRLRWEKNAEGYVTYYSYHKTTGRLGYIAADVDPSATTLPAGATDTTWISWNDDGSGSYSSTDKPSRDNTNLPTPLALVTRQEYDIQGRPTLLTNPGGDRHYTRYDTSRTIEFPNLDSSTNKPQMPTRVRVFNDADQTVEVYSVRADYTAISTAGGVPTEFSTAPSQDDYVSWTKLTYDDKNGELIYVDRYHDIPAAASGLGTISTNYNRTVLQYDVQNRQAYSIQQVSGSPGSGGNGVEQVQLVVYDKFGRVAETKRGVSDASHNMGANYDSYPSSLTTVSKTFYDGGDATTPLKVGDGYVTSTRSYYATSDYIETNLYHNFRGQLRAIQRKNDTTAFTPYTIQDVDWGGRPIDQAQYTSSITDFAAVAADEDYVSTTSSGRNYWTKTHYDDLGNVYQTETYPGTETTNHLVTNSHYDRMARLVCTGDKYGAHVETAYDGAGRQYQTRTVKDVSSSTPYSSGAFVYNAPLPKPDFAAMSSGNGGVIELSHTEFDAAGNATASHMVELNHDDTNGISLTGGTPTGGVRTTTHNYYDAVHRPITSAYYGAADHNDGAVSWKSADLPTRDTGTSTSFTSSADRLITQYSYEADTGQLSIVTDSAGTKTKTFYDDAGRRTYATENWANFSPPSTGIGDASDKSKDRVTRWQYNGLGQVTKLTAYNSDGTSDNPQDTNYYYLDSHDAALVTHTVYPDSTDTPTSGTDLVTMTYNLDGSPATRTDQRGVVMTYTYDTARRLSREGATTIPTGVDGTVKSIGRTYDDLGRVEKITSYPNDNGTGTPVNEVKYTRGGAQGLITKTEQSHAGAVTGGTLAVEYAFDTGVASSTTIYNNGLRPKMVTYPNTNRKIHTTYGSAGSIADVLGRADMLEADSSGSPGDDLVVYAYNGTSRVVEVDYTDNDSGPGVRRQMFGVDSAGTNDYNGFDRFGRTVTQEWRKYHSGAALRDRQNYTYDYAGNRLTAANDHALCNWLDFKYEYDGLHRYKHYELGTLSSGSISNLGWQEVQALDQLGNWTRLQWGAALDYLDQSRTHNAVNETGTIGVNSGIGDNWADPVHDTAGNMTTMPSSHDPTNTFALTYDAWNRLVSVSFGIGPSYAYEYDGLGRRTRKDPAGGTSNDIDYYYNEEWQLLEERKGGDTDPLAQYVWHPYYIDALAIRWYDADTNGNLAENNDGAHYYLHDANFNVRAVTNASGTVLERNRYTPYGGTWFLDASFNTLSGNVSAIGNTHVYTGRERDPETGLQLNRHRFYADILGRWLTRDPVVYGDSYNLYEYVRSNPVNGLDPEGLIIVYPPIPDPGAIAEGKKCARAEGDCNTCCRFKYWKHSDKYVDCYLACRKERGAGPPPNPCTIWEVYTDCSRSKCQTDCSSEWGNCFAQSFVVCAPLKPLGIPYLQCVAAYQSYCTGQLAGCYIKCDQCKSP